MFWYQAQSQSAPAGAAPERIHGYLSKGKSKQGKEFLFFNVVGNTFPIKAELDALGFRYFQGKWSTLADKARAARAELERLGVDVSALDDPGAKVLESPAKPAADAGQPQTAADKALAEMKAELQKEMSENPQAKGIMDFVDRMIDKVAASVDEAAKSEFVKRFLAFAAQFYHYSFGNQMLIWFQKPDATYVGGAKSWMGKNRQVVNWGNGISILAPAIKKLKREPTQRERETLPPGQDTVEVTRTYFMPVKVYDISDTAPIPGKEKEAFDPGSWRKDPNEAAEHITLLVDAAVGYAKSMGIQVDLEKELGKEMGGYSKGKEIGVNKLFKGINQFSTAIHEIAHEVMHQVAERLFGERGARELEAETVAYIVLKFFGYETVDAPNYIALWRGTGEGVRKRRQGIQQAAKQVIDGIQGRLGSAEEVVPEEEAPPAAPEAPATASWVSSICKFARA